MSKTPMITPNEDGPLLVKNEPLIRDVHGAAIAGKPTMALCRCGASQNKPFCDGAHTQIGFKSGPEPEGLRNTPIDYNGVAEGVSVTISYTPALCVHAAD